jgi:hypothetical protein
MPTLAPNFAGSQPRSRFAYVNVRLSTLVDGAGEARRVRQTPARGPAQPELSRPRWPPRCCRGDRENRRVRHRLRQVAGPDAGAESPRQTSRRNTAPRRCARRSTECPRSRPCRRSRGRYAGMCQRLPRGTSLRLIEQDSTVRQEPPPNRSPSRLQPARIAGAGIAAPAMNVAPGSRTSRPVICGAALSTAGLVCQRHGHVSAERWLVCF